MLIGRIAAAALLIVLAGCSSGSGTPGASPSPSISGIVTYTGLSRQHVLGHVDYPQTPPVGGPHSPTWATCMGSVYSKPLHNENGVHSMEHGAVWVTYRPSLAAADVQLLASDIQGKSYTMLSPYPGLPHPVVATAWGLQLPLDSASDPRLVQFIDTYAHGPQTPEQDAPCTPAPPLK